MGFRNVIGEEEGVCAHAFFFVDPIGMRFLLAQEMHTIPQELESYSFFDP